MTPLQVVTCAGDISMPNVCLMYGCNLAGVASLPRAFNALRTASTLVMFAGFGVAVFSAIVVNSGGDWGDAVITLPHLSILTIGGESPPTQVGSTPSLPVHPTHPGGPARSSP